MSLKLKIINQDEIFANISIIKSRTISSEPYQNVQTMEIDNQISFKLSAT